MHHKYIVKTTSRDGIATLINDVIFYYAKKEPYIIDVLHYKRLNLSYYCCNYIRSEQHRPCLTLAASSADFALFQ